MDICEAVYYYIVSARSNSEQIVALTDLKEGDVEGLFHLDVRLRDFEEGMAFTLELTVLYEKLFKS